MSLLPKAAEEFRNRDYWDQFFAKVGAEAFEWYSDFVDLANVLCKYIKARDEVLVIGCGNSTLSSDLYDTGIEQITNIDLSEKVIKQMRKQNEKKRANMKWLSMDARKMTFNDQQFSVVLDKGTIDALMSNRTEQVLNDINQILEEVDRVLRPTGRFICITLAQKHILDHLSEYFFHQKSWLLRYHHIQTSKSFALPVFAFVFTKMTLKTPLIEVQLYSDAEKNWLRFHDLSNALDAIRQCQITCFRKYDFKQKFVPGSETPLIDLYDERDQTKRRYQMIVTNSRTKHRNRPFAAFIVPKSRNLDWLYSTAKGRQQILSTAQYTTMVFIYLQPDQEYRDLEQVKAEMTNAVLDFKPAQSSENLQIPFLSSSEGIGDVKIREQSATFIIEDCLSSGEGNENRWKRRLRFHSNPNLIQSEVHLHFDSTSNELQPDYSIVDDDYHGAMIACLQGYFKSSPQGQWLLIGLGGGVLSMKLLRAFPKIRLTGVDIDAEMLRLAKKWFGLDDQRSTCVIEDGLQYLDRQVREKISFDVIIIDVNNDDNQSSLRCPHPSFLNDSVLSNVHQLLSSSSSGLFLLNFASRDPSSPDRDRCRTELLQHFSHLSSLKLDEDINEIFLCSDQSLEKISMNKSIDSNLKELFEKLRLEK